MRRGLRSKLLYPETFSKAKIELLNSVMETRAVLVFTVGGRDYEGRVVPQSTPTGSYEPVFVDLYDVPFAWAPESVTRIRRKDYRKRTAARIGGVL